MFITQLMPQQCRLRRARGRPTLALAACAVLTVWTLVLAAVPIPVRAAESSADIAGFGIVAASGVTDNGATVRRLGFTSRRLRDGGRLGSLALVAEEQHNGFAVTRLNPSLRAEDVDLTYQALYVELRRFFPLAGHVLYFWSLRGGITRLSGSVNSGGVSRNFQQDQVAPLLPLAVPLALENPGFLLLGLLEGASLGLSLDLVQDRIWLELQESTALVPRLRTADIAVDTPFVNSTAVTLTIAF